MKTTQVPDYYAACVLLMDRVLRGEAKRIIWMARDETRHPYPFSGQHRFVEFCDYIERAGYRDMVRLTQRPWLITFENGATVHIWDELSIDAVRGRHADLVVIELGMAPEKALMVEFCVLRAFREDNEGEKILIGM